MSKHYVNKWQKLLDQSGHNCGPADGDFGPRTYDASISLLGDTKPEPDKSAMEPKRFPIGGVERPRYAPNIIAVYRQVNELIWHCAATPEGRDFTVSDIRKWHRARGWTDIGYHYVVLLDGSVMVGRPLNKTGAHVKGRNLNTIGACYIGGVSEDSKVPKDTRTPEQIASMIWLTKELIRTQNISIVSGHNQYAAKACPSFDVRTDTLGNLPGF